MNFLCLVQAVESFHHFSAFAEEIAAQRVVDREKPANTKLTRLLKKDTEGKTSVLESLV